MASAKKKSREQLIAGGYCPTCSKCTAQTGDGLMGCGMLYGCRKCGTLLFELLGSEDDPDTHPGFVDVTGRWEEIQSWYNERHSQIWNHAYELEAQLQAELPEVLSSVFHLALHGERLKLVKRR